MLSELYKGKGAVSTCLSYRDVNLADNSAKVFGKRIRSSLLEPLQACTFETQFGSGLHGGETAIAHLYLRAVLDYGHVAKKAVAILFLDIVTAFASMVRRIVFEVDEGDEAWLHKLSSAGFAHEEVQEIYTEVCKTCHVR